MPPVQGNKPPKIVGTSALAYIDAGLGHIIPLHKVEIVFKAEGREALRIRRGFKQRGMVLDFTGGDKTRSMLLLVPSGYLVLSPKTPSAIARALQEWHFEQQFGRKKK